MLPMLKTVMSSMFKKRSTVLYPVEKAEQPAGMRGLIINNVDLCILCGICQNKCPTGAIVVERTARTWAIAQYDCVQCGNCVAVCPVKSLTMAETRPEAVTEKHMIVCNVPPPAPKPAVPVVESIPVSQETK